MWPLFHMLYTVLSHITYSSPTSLESEPVFHCSHWKPASSRPTFRQRCTHRSYRSETLL